MTTFGSEEIPLPVRTFAISFNRRDRTTRTFELSNLEAELSDEEVFSWIDVQAKDIGMANHVLGRLGADIVLTSHFNQTEVLPRIVEREDCLGFYLYEVEDPERHLDTSQGLTEMDFVRLIVVIGQDFLLTFHRRDVDAVGFVRERCQESFKNWGKTPSFVMFLFLQRCLYDYAHLNLANDNFLDQLETRRTGGDRGSLPEDVRLASRNILTLKKLAASLHIVLMLLATKRSLFISEESRSSYQEMLQNASALRAAIDSSRDMLDGVLASVQAEAAQRTGEIARVLTVVSTVVLPLTLIAGIYGMNFKHMPELELPWGYFGALALMAAVGAGLLMAFFRLGWLGRRRFRFFRRKR
jgi:magnesium transporter